MSQSSLSRCIKVVTTELCKLAATYIRFPQTHAEIVATKVDFHRKLGLPGIIGALDGCHIPIQQPSHVINGHLYYNRKRFCSLNVLAACDANLRFTYIDANFPGSVHDSAIWTTSDLRAHMHQNHNTGKQ